MFMQLIRAQKRYIRDFLLELWVLCNKSFSLKRMPGDWGGGDVMD